MILHPKYQDFRNEDRIKRMAEEQDPDNPAQVFIKQIRNHVFTRNFQNVHTTMLTNAIVRKQIIQEERLNADKQKTCSEDC